MLVTTTLPFNITKKITSFVTSRNVKYMWCDQAKSVWSRSHSVFIFLTNSMHHFHSYILQKIQLKLVNWFQRYDQLKDAKNNRKQKTFSALFASILISIFPTSDWFCLITSHIIEEKSCFPYSYVCNSWFSGYLSRYLYILFLSQLALFSLILSFHFFCKHALFTSTCMPTFWLHLFYLCVYFSTIWEQCAYFIK